VIRRGGLPAEYRSTLQPYLTRYGDELARDKGGRDNLTAAKRGLIDIIQASRAAWMIALIEAGRRGFIRDITAGAAGKASWDFAPGFREASPYMTLERQALSDLGFDRVAKPVETLSDIVAEYAAASASNGPESEAARQGEAAETQRPRGPTRVLSRPGSAKEKLSDG
jgi:hypothetical protein